MCVQVMEMTERLFVDLVLWGELNTRARGF